MNHKYCETYEYNVFMCENCDIIKSHWFNPHTKCEEIGYYYKNLPKSGWIDLFCELTCEEMIIKKIIE